MSSISRGCAALVISAVGCVALGRWAIARLAAWGATQPFRYEDCPPLQPLHAGKQHTPSMGGLLVLGVATIAAVLLGGLAGRDGWLVLLAIAGLGGIGFVDDFYKLRRPNAGGLRKRPKLVLALGIGAVIGVMTVDRDLGYRAVALPWTSARWDPGILWIPLAMGVVAGTAHAVNLTDGMDGLAAGLLVVAFIVFGALAAEHMSWAFGASRSVPVWCGALAGACLGFLWFNAHPASVFLGDVGALALGAALGTAALLSHLALGLLLIGGVFVAEALSVMLQIASYKWRNKRRIFRVAPLHHHFHVGGISETCLVIRFWIVGLLLAAAGYTAFARS